MGGRRRDVVDEDVTRVFFKLFAIKCNKNLVEVVELVFHFFQSLSTIAIELEFVGLLRSTIRGN